MLTTIEDETVGARLLSTKRKSAGPARPPPTDPRNAAARSGWWSDDGFNGYLLLPHEMEMVTEFTTGSRAPRQRYVHEFWDEEHAFAPDAWWIAPSSSSSAVAAAGGGAGLGAGAPAPPSNTKSATAGPKLLLHYRGSAEKILSLVDTLDLQEEPIATV